MNAMRNAPRKCKKEKITMSENTENTNVTEVVSPSEEDKEIVVELQEEAEEEPKRGSPEYNFKELRKKNEELEKELRETQRYIRESQRPSKREEPEEEDELDNLSGDDWLTVNQAKKLAIRQAEELIKQREFETLEDRVRLKFKDYDDVVSESNVLQLIENDDDLAQTIKNSPNPYVAAYKLIKKSSFYKETEEGKKYKTETNNIQKNAHKPVSSNAVTSKPLAKANSYASADLSDLYREMTEYAKRR